MRQITYQIDRCYATLLIKPFDKSKHTNSQLKFPLIQGKLNWLSNNLPQKNRHSGEHVINKSKVKCLPFDTLWNYINPPRTLEKSKFTKHTTKLQRTRVFYNRFFKIEKPQKTSLSKTGGTKL